MTTDKITKVRKFLERTSSAWQIQCDIWADAARKEGVEIDPGVEPILRNHVSGIALSLIDELIRTRDDLFEANNRYLQEARDGRAKVRELQAQSANGAPERVLPIHRHKKRGSRYVLIGIGKMQTEMWEERTEGTIDRAGIPESVDMREVAIYRDVDDGSLWARPREEFEDGRYEAIPAEASDNEWEGLDCGCGGGAKVGHKAGCPENAAAAITAIETIGRKVVLLLSALKEIAGNGDATGRNPQVIVDTAMAAIMDVDAVGDD